MLAGVLQDLRYIDPQQTVPGRVVVVTNDLVEQMTVALRPDQGQAPTSQTFGREGGQVEVFVITQDVASVEIDWSAQVAFTPTGWSSIPVLVGPPIPRKWLDRYDQARLMDCRLSSDGRPR